MEAIRDGNFVPVALGVSTVSPTITIPFSVDPATGKLQTNNASTTSGTVTSVATDSTLIGGPITTTGTLGINLANSNTWTAAQIISSTSATAFSVGANGATNPAFQIDASTASSVTGLVLKSAASGGGITATVTSTGANEGIQIISKGAGNITLNSASGSVALRPNGNTVLQVNRDGVVIAVPAASSNANKLSVTGGADTALTASTEAIGVNLNLNQTRQWATGTLTLQRDVIAQGTTYAFVGASGLTDAATSAIVLGNGGTNATVTNLSGLLIQTRAISGTVTNSYGLNITAASGATNNFAAQFIGLTALRGAQIVNRTTVADAPYTVLITDYIVAYTTLTTGRAVTLPTATATYLGQIFIIKDETGNAGASNLTITPTSGTIDGAANKVISSAYGVLRVYSNGTNYFTF